jgi:signal transduction histidine kinase
VTSIHRLEQEKRRLDRLASLGEMAANVAHEVRNPLASIKTSVQVLMDDLAESDRHANVLHDTDWAQESVSVVLKEVERLDSIVRDLLLFARPRRLHRVKCDLIKISDHVLQLLQAQCVVANVEIHRVYGDVPPLWADMAQVEQIVFNLYMNALQAMPEGGVLTIACRVLTAEATTGDDIFAAHLDTVRQPFYLEQMGERPITPSGWLELAVSDTGVGIPPEQIERIFQPFFTTKAHGIGLGLPITRRLVEDHGGLIRVESQFGYGATIMVQFPLLPDEATRVLDNENEDRESRSWR